MGHKTVNRDQRKQNREQKQDTGNTEQEQRTKNRKLDGTWNIEYGTWKINRKDGTNREQGARNGELKTGN